LNQLRWKQTGAPQQSQSSPLCAGRTSAIANSGCVTIGMCRGKIFHTIVSPKRLKQREVRVRSFACITAVIEYAHDRDRSGEARFMFVCSEVLLLNGIKL
jgi:hypothetical protein